MSDSAANHIEESFEFDCPECGAHIEGEVDRCPKCGVEFVIEEVSEAECPQCHETIPVDCLKCPYCGLAFSAPSEAEEPRAEVQEAPVEVRPAIEPEPARTEIEEEPLTPVFRAEPEPEPQIEAPSAPVSAPAKAPAEDGPAAPDRLKDEFSELVGRVKPLLALAKDFSIDAVDARKLINRAVELGKNKDVEGAVRTLRECSAALDQAIGAYMDKEFSVLEELAEVARKTGGDPDPIVAATESARAMRAQGDVEGTLTKIRAGKKFAEQLTGPYVSAHEMYEALEKLVQTSEIFFLDVREIRKVLGESKEAGENGDWNTMAALARKGREDLVRMLPDLLKGEMHKAKQSMMEAKLQGRDVNAGVKALKEAASAVKLKRYEDALYLMADLKSSKSA